jgi:hypothetical protein
MAQKLDIAFWSYDRTRLLADGSVKIEGADVAFHSARIVPEIFEAMIRRRPRLTSAPRSGRLAAASVASPRHSADLPR